MSRKEGGSLIHFAFMPLPNFSMIALFNAVEILRMANQLSEQKPYKWSIVSPEGGMVTASNGLEIDTVQAAGDEKIDVVFVCSGYDVKHVTTAAHLATLRRLAYAAHTLGGICTGAYVLARAGLLAGHACTIHWEYLTSLEYEFRNSRLTKEIFVIDRDRVTCSGGVAPLHMMLNLITPQIGHPLAMRIAQQFAIEHIYKPRTLQKIAIGVGLGSVSRTLSYVIFLMESNIEDPLSQKDLATRAEVSTRQLQRLFRAQLGVTPLHYFLTLRLRRARQLLYQTSMSIVEVGVCCGFKSAAYFSKSYRDEFGIAPTHDRRKKSAISRTHLDSLRP